jgi:hypothetical protein
MVESSYSKHLKDSGVIVTDPALVGAFTRAVDGNMSPQQDAGTTAPSMNQHSRAVDLQGGAMHENS